MEKTTEKKPKVNTGKTATPLIIKTPILEKLTELARQEDMSRNKFICHIIEEFLAGSWTLKV
ncbi:MAG: hypothetical protein ABIH74_04710 [Candidatus Omnitrophota bacterium]